MTALMVFCTCPSDEVAASLAQGLVEAKLAACVNRISGVQSTYRWQGKVQVDSEYMLLIKTTQARYGEVVAFIKQHHPYELPEIVAVELCAGSPEYLQWLAQETKL